MSFVKTQPELIYLATGELRSVGSTVRAQRVAMAGPTTAVAPPASDVVSALTTAQFNAHGALFQAVAAQAEAVQQMFVATLTGNAGSYAAAEAANAVAAG